MCGPLDQVSNLSAVRLLGVQSIRHPVESNAHGMDPLNPNDKLDKMIKGNNLGDVCYDG